jgi:predicted glycoside hydrolase/deacetylase ChbG (UPF0249 family)
VTADDVGLHPGMTAGAIRAHRHGIVTACSIVANGEAFEDAVERLRDEPGLAVGVHLSLVEERPLTAIRVARSYASFLPRYPFVSSAAIERELRAQIERVLATGLHVTHLNGHQHLHALPRIFAIVSRLAREYGIGYVRVPADVVGPSRGESFARRASLRALGAVALFSRRHAGGLRTNDAAIGIAAAGHLAVPLLLALLDQVSDGVTELVTHPGLGDAALTQRYPQWQYAWDAETEALCDERVRRQMEARGIVLTTPESSA